MASIEKYTTTSGKVRYQVRYRGLDRRQHKKCGFPTRKQAQQWMTSIEHDQLTGNFVAPSRGRVTVREVYLEWITTLTVSTNTLKTRKSVWKNHVEPRWGTHHIGDVTREAAKAWPRQMQNDGVGAATIHQAVTILRLICEHAVDGRRIAANPVTKLKLTKLTPKKRNYLTANQVEALVKEVDTGGTMVRFLAFTGLRFGEMASLTVSDFDLLRRRVTVSKSTQGATKTGKSRIVPLPRFLIDDLSVLMVGKERDALVFTANGGGAVDNNNYRNRILTPAVKRCAEGDPLFPTGLTLHDLRHTAASLAISTGANVLAVQRILGHQSAAMTLDVYADLFDDDLQAVADAFDSLVKTEAG